AALELRDDQSALAPAARDGRGAQHDGGDGDSSSHEPSSSHPRPSSPGTTISNSLVPSRLRPARKMLRAGNTLRSLEGGSSLASTTTSKVSSVPGITP